MNMVCPLSWVMRACTGIQTQRVFGQRRVGRDCVQAGPYPRGGRVPRSRGHCEQEQRSDLHVHELQPDRQVRGKPEGRDGLSDRPSLNAKTVLRGRFYLNEAAGRVHAGLAQTKVNHVRVTGNAMGEVAKALLGNQQTCSPNARLTLCGQR